MRRPELKLITFRKTKTERERNTEKLSHNTAYLYSVTNENVIVTRQCLSIMSYRNIMTSAKKDECIKHAHSYFSKRYIQILWFKIQYNA